jgi:hypothetical protein
MKTLMQSLAVILALAAVGPAQSADLLSSQPVAVAQCVGGESSLLAVESKSELKDSIDELMEDSIAVASSPQWVGSARPVFLWASETKVACGKAHGYLRSGTRDAENIYKCECFHARMTSYMN